MVLAPYLGDQLDFSLRWVLMTVEGRGGRAGLAQRGPGRWSRPRPLSWAGDAHRPPPCSPAPSSLLRRHPRVGPRPPPMASFYCSQLLKALFPQSHVEARAVRTPAFGRQGGQALPRFPHLPPRPSPGVSGLEKCGLPLPPSSSLHSPYLPPFISKPQTSAFPHPVRSPPFTDKQIPRLSKPHSHVTPDIS